MTMRISVDFNRCEGHGMCEQFAPEVFELDEDGNLINHYEGQELEGERAAAAERAAGVCPVAALTTHK